MKQKITLLLVLIITGILGSQAQQQDQAQPRPRRTVEERVKMVMDKVIPDLQLTTQQQTDVTATFSDYFKANEKLMQGLEPGTRPDRDAMMKNMDARDAKLKVNLTEAQYKKFKDEIEPSMRRPGGQRPAGDKPVGDKQPAPKATDK